jgi:carbamoyl-phosphate synthase small subunit
MSKNIKKKAILALENGSIHEGVSGGAEEERVGWVSFYTGVVGYQEVITSPSNAGKIVVMTYPLIGNYGVAKKCRESKQCWTEAVIIKENSRIASNWQAEDNFLDFLKDEKVLAVEAVDTRALMVELRGSGEQWGIISTKDFEPRSLNKKIRQAKVEEPDFIKKISTKGIVRLATQGKAVAVIDIGVTNSLLRQLTKIGSQPNLMPYLTRADDILALSPKWVIISDGPEMDKGLSTVVEIVKQLLGKLPIVGVGTGCQILAMAMGAEVKRMHFGHHGLNYPIVREDSLKGEITVQNHSYAIDESSLGGDIEITWRNMNDKTVEGIQNKRLNAFGCQFYPASPGMGEVNPVLEEFIKNI